ncbi:DUF853 domain-containing protein, partial [Stenotrophomonas maltophilia]|uniref:DUF853 domain-containing protein n=1 Tax=Stenotrophomonas maltophilia TaxID=40324 RepID=UPI00215AA18C
MSAAEDFARSGVPVLLADVRDDVTGVAVPGAGAENLLKRAAEIGVARHPPAARPALFWDLCGKAGPPGAPPVRGVGPDLLARPLALHGPPARRAGTRVQRADARGL